MKTNLYITLLALVSATGSAQITTVSPFSGTVTESWESFPNFRTPGPVSYLSSPTTIMGGAASITHPQMAVYEPTAPGNANFGLSAFNAKVQDGLKGMGIDTPTPILETASISFTLPISDYGAFWGSDTTQPLITLSFYDAADSLIGTASFNYVSPDSAGALEWQGWHSSVPVSRLTYNGHAVATDSLRATVVPEPATSVLLLVGFAAFCARRRSSASNDE